MISFTREPGTVPVGKTGRALVEILIQNLQQYPGDQTELMFLREDQEEILSICMKEDKIVNKNPLRRVFIV